MRALFGRPKKRHRLTTSVVNLKWHAEPDFVAVHRPNALGNPFPIGGGRARSAAIVRFSRWLAADPDRLALAHSLRGEKLGCFCAPTPCHADVIAFVAEGILDPLDAGDVVGVHQITAADYASGRRALPKQYRRRRCSTEEKR